MMNDVNVIQAFISITSCSEEVAANYLIATNDNLEFAVDLYFNSGHNSNQSNQSSSSAIHDDSHVRKHKLPTNTESFYDNYYDVDSLMPSTDDKNKNSGDNYQVRAPDKVKRQRLVETYIGKFDIYLFSSFLSLHKLA